ncbi:hypothetical protein BD777DRAFT_126633 [Yarrowia lipolytica]|nr:hypothetical protein BD777DRAFT_126633 [Yarrowia lipolytica]
MLGLHPRIVLGRVGINILGSKLGRKLGALIICQGGALSAYVKRVSFIWVRRHTEWRARRAGLTIEKSWRRHVIIVVLGRRHVRRRRRRRIEGLGRLGHGVFSSLSDSVSVSVSDSDSVSLSYICWLVCVCLWSVFFSPIPASFSKNDGPISRYLGPARLPAVFTI